MDLHQALGSVYTEKLPLSLHSVHQVQVFAGSSEQSVVVERLKFNLNYSKVEVEY